MKVTRWGCDSASMKLAIVGSRGLTVDLESYVPAGVTLIVSGAAAGIDRAAAEYARARGIELVEYVPNYARYRRGAPLKRNEQIVDAADRVLAFWDGASAGTKSVIDLCAARSKPCTVYVWTKGSFVRAAER